MRAKQIVLTIGIALAPLSQAAENLFCEEPLEDFRCAAPMTVTIELSGLSHVKSLSHQDGFRGVCGWPPFTGLSGGYGYAVRSLTGDRSRDSFNLYKVDERTYSDAKTREHRRYGTLRLSEDKRTAIYYGERAHPFEDGKPLELNCRITRF